MFALALSVITATQGMVDKQVVFSLGATLRSSCNPYVLSIVFGFLLVLFPYMLLYKRC